METKPLPPRPHQMRVMLVANLAVENRFANGAQGRLLHWHPAGTTDARRAIVASHPELLVRFVKEQALKRAELLPEADFMDWGARQETIGGVRGDPVIYQLPVVPANALTIHKTQVAAPLFKKCA